MRSVLRRLLDDSYESKRNQWRSIVAFVHDLDLTSPQALVNSMLASETVGELWLLQPQAPYIAAALKSCGGRVVRYGPRQRELRAALVALRAIPATAPEIGEYHASSSVAQTLTSPTYIPDGYVDSLIYKLWRDDYELFGGAMDHVPDHVLSGEPPQRRLSPVVDLPPLQLPPAPIKLYEADGIVAHITAGADVEAEKSRMKVAFFSMDWSMDVRVRARPDPFTGDWIAGTYFGYYLETTAFYNQIQNLHGRGCAMTRGDRTAETW